jgi:N-acetyl sugar amidotransferase
MIKNKQICSRCVMDTTDPDISFDATGVCNHCRNFNEVTVKDWFPNDEGAKRLAKIIDNIKRAGVGRKYDCIIGLSGGVDSSYLALKTSQWGLRPLVVHVDAGWNSELAVANIEKIVRHCNYDLHTHVVDWTDMRDLHIAYLKAGIANQDVPQDHIFFASLYHFAIRNNIKYILSGGNIATECVFPRAWHGSAMDSMNLKSIHKKYGEKKLRHYKTISFFDLFIWYPFIKRLRTIRPLNFLPYDKFKSINELVDTIGYKPYARKHGESLFTKFFQNYYLPEKFGYDKRKPHLSSLIVSGQISRFDALERLAEPLYDSIELESDKAYFCKKLRISDGDLDRLMLAPIHSYADFPNWDGRYKILKDVQKILEKLLKLRFKVYS